MLVAAYVYCSVTTGADSAVWGGYYKYFDIRSEINSIVDYSKVVAIIPLSATSTSEAGTCALIGNYTYAQDLTSTAFVLNAGRSGTYRAKFLVFYRE